MATFSAANNNVPVEAADSFPNPVIRRCVQRRARVYTEPQHLEGKVILESASGNVYEIGTVLKKAIFGHVNHAIILTRTDQPDVFSRSVHQVAIKVYSKRTLRTLQGRVQENPLTEITAMQYIGKTVFHDKYLLLSVAY